MSIQQQLRNTFGLPTGNIQSATSGGTLKIECASTIDRDRILSGNIAHLCRTALRLGYQFLVVIVSGTALTYRYGLAALLALAEVWG